MKKQNKLKFKFELLFEINEDKIRQEKSIILYGHISYWDTSKVTDMSHLFKNLKKFNDKIDNWNVSQVTNMNFMFSDASSFNQPINNWNISQVTNMECMFYNADSFKSEKHKFKKNY